MATVKQLKAIELLPKHKNVAKYAMQEAGYSVSTSRQPKSKLFETDGVQELLEKAGLNKSFVLEALHSDIKNKKGNRKGELELALKIFGMLKERHVVEGLTVEINTTLSDLKKIVDNESNKTNNK